MAKIEQGMLVEKNIIIYETEKSVGAIVKSKTFKEGVIPYVDREIEKGNFIIPEEKGLMFYDINHGIEPTVMKRMIQFIQQHNNLLILVVVEYDTFKEKYPNRAHQLLPYIAEVIQHL